MVGYVKRVGLGGVLEEIKEQWRIVIGDAISFASEAIKGKLQRKPFVANLLDLTVFFPALGRMGREVRLVLSMSYCHQPVVAVVEERIMGRLIAIEDDVPDALTIVHPVVWKRNPLVQLR